jgi:histone H2B
MADASGEGEATKIVEDSDLPAEPVIAARPRKIATRKKAAAVASTSARTKPAPASKSVKSKPSPKVMLPQSRLIGTPANNSEELFASQSQSLLPREVTLSEEEGNDSTATEGDEDQTEDEVSPSEDEEEEEEAEEDGEEQEEEDETGAGEEVEADAPPQAKAKSAEPTVHAPAVPAAATRKEISKDKKKKQKSKKKASPSMYSMYIYRVHRQLHKDLTVSTKTMDIMNSFVNDMFERIATEASSLARLNRRQTLGAREVETATRLVLGYTSLADHAIAEGLKAMTLYSRSVEKDKQ